MEKERENNYVEDEYIEDEDIDKYGNLNQEKLKDVASKSLLRTVSLCTSAFGALVLLQKPELSTKDKILGCVFAFIATVAVGSIINDARKKKAQKKEQKNAHKDDEIQK